MNTKATVAIPLAKMVVDTWKPVISATAMVAREHDDDLLQSVQE